MRVCDRGLLQVRGTSEVCGFSLVDDTIGLGFARTLEDGAGKREKTGECLLEEDAQGEARNGHTPCLPSEARVFGHASTDQRFLLFYARDTIFTAAYPQRQKKLRLRTLLTPSSSFIASLTMFLPMVNAAYHHKLNCVLDQPPIQSALVFPFLIFSTSATIYFMGIVRDVFQLLVVKLALVSVTL